MDDPRGNLATDWAEKNSAVNQFGTKCYPPFVCHTMNMFDPRVRYHRDRQDEWACEWCAPYGFVPEAGCPEHD
jgi:hypothetical protein